MDKHMTTLRTLLHFQRQGQPVMLIDLEAAEAEGARARRGSGRGSSAHLGDMTTTDKDA